MAKTTWVATHNHNNLEPPNGVPLRFRERFDASRPSSSPGVRRGVGSGDACAARPTMGEYERKPGVGAGENEETCGKAGMSGIRRSREELCQTICPCREGWHHAATGFHIDAAYILRTTNSITRTIAHTPHGRTKGRGRVEGSAEIQHRGATKQDAEFVAAVQAQRHIASPRPDLWGDLG